jgi:hemoglobin-like flavoprotein
MTPEQVALVKETWRGVVPIRDTFADLFYRKLFDLDPALRPLFKGDLREQGRNLVAMLSIAVRHLHQSEKVLQGLRELGRRHVQYGVREQHYVTLGTALILTLDVSLGEAFTPEARGAWEKAYELVSRSMTAPC